MLPLRLCHCSPGPPSSGQGSWVSTGWGWTSHVFPALLPWILFQRIRDKPPVWKTAVRLQGEGTARAGPREPELGPRARGPLPAFWKSRGPGGRKSRGPGGREGPGAEAARTWVRHGCQGGRPLARVPVTWARCPSGPPFVPCVAGAMRGLAGLPCGRLVCTHLWVRGLPALQWDRDIRGALGRQGGPWSLGGLGGPGAPRDQAGRWSLGPGASSGEQPAGQFALLEKQQRGLGSSGGRRGGAVQTRALKGSLFIDWKRWDCSGRLGCCRSPW